MDQPHLPPIRNLTGIRWFIDTHILDIPEAGTLRKLYELGWIYLQIPDTVITEVSSAKNPDVQSTLISQASSYMISKGPNVLGSSLIGLSILGSDSDQARIVNIHKLIWGKSFESDLPPTGSRKGLTRVRDTLIINNVIHYQADALITEDRALQGSQARLQEVYPGIQIMSAENATTEALMRVSKIRNVSKVPLPEWP